MKKRILMLFTVVALMGVMIAMSVAPAFAAWEANGCRTGDTLVGGAGGSQQTDEADHNNDDFVCIKDGNKTRIYDNRT